MKAFILLSLLPIAASWATDEFVAFKSKFGKQYATPAEEKLRQRIFENNMAIAKKDNEEAGDEIFGATKFSDLTPDEFKSQYLNYRRSSRPFRGNVEVAVPSAPASEAVDWRTKQEGVVSAVKNQGNCGSCWAYSATEEIESMWVLAGNDPIKFSPQQIISCDKNDLGCNGGDTITAYKYVMKANGMATEADYKDTSQRTGHKGKCKEFKVAGGDISGHSFATPECAKGACNDQDEDTMAANIEQTGPASICVNAEKWQNYKKGVMTKQHCGKHNANSLDHCVQVVGFSGYTKGEKTGYWLVRNSWETDWGIDGYIHLQMGENTCGVANEATFVKIKSYNNTDVVVA